MRISDAFLPLLKECPSEATIASHQLMLRAGLVRQTASGIYAWLPLGLKVLRKIAEVIRSEQDRMGGQEVLMPTIQAAELWQKSGRYDDYGLEMLRIQDRQKREFLYGPTNEEQITDLFAQNVKSYRQLPQYLYQIQWKFRDEIRPRFGVMRGREFYMKDGYSFDKTPEDAEKTYFKVMASYLKTFARLGVKAVPMAADTGPIGGKLSHEFLVLAPTGESAVFYDAKWEDAEFLNNLSADTDAELKSMAQTVSDIYAATEEQHDETEWAKVKDSDKCEGRGIEVGHIFSFGDKYTKSMGVSIPDSEDKQFHPLMGSYGIGVSRLVGAIIESSHDEHGIIWPAEVAPFKVHLINLQPKNEESTALAEKFYKLAPEHILYDDRSERAGVKFNEADLLGMPWQVIVGPKIAADGNFEIKNRATGETRIVSFDDAVSTTLPRL